MLTVRASTKQSCANPFDYNQQTKQNFAKLSHLVVVVAATVTIFLSLLGPLI